MKAKPIITVGICPSWDVICQVDGLAWGEHKKILSQQLVCAGKAFNISRALAWVGLKNTVAGLWGLDDYQQMLESVKDIRDFIDIRFTKAPGRTRQNITVFDTQTHREIHLRDESKLAGKKSLRQLMAELKEIVSEQSTVVFAGSLPGGELLDDCLSIITEVRDSGAKIVIDTSGKALKEIVHSGGIWLLKPNVEELRELLDESVEDKPSSIANAGRKLCEKARMVVVSRGAEGAIVITQEAAFQGKITGDGKETISTIGCGDYLLAGFLTGLKDTNDISAALGKAIKVATARAYRLTENTSWTDIESQIDVEVCRL
ncbi:MAG: 1-phosphofructokinase family hexose kinase [Planctomycetota bacterium]|jgi:1-phosphofructokinase family hexose kinase